MKKIKTLFFVVSMLLSATLLSGCMSMVYETKINDDYSGIMTLTSGILKEVYDAIPEADKQEMQIEEISTFEYNGNEYVGDVQALEFRNITELNNFDADEGSGINSGETYFSVNEDGEIEFTYIVNNEVGMTEEMETSVINGASASGVTNDKEYDEFLKTFVIRTNWEFPRNVVQTEGPKMQAITVDGNAVLIDILALSDEVGNNNYTFKFVTTANSGAIAQKILFNDVVQNDWFYTQVYKMVDKGLFVGKTDKLFCPLDTMTKAEFVTVIARMLYDEETLKIYEKNENVWWDAYYNVCINEGLFTEEQFSYDTMTKGIKREEMAFITMSYLTKIKNESGADVIVPVVIEKIPDKNLINEKYKDGVAYCYQKGILCGINDKGTFNPQATLTRAEATTVIDRILDKDVRIVTK